MGDSQGTWRHDRLSMPVLAHVASPSPAKARRRPGNERPALSTADMGPVKLPSELFALATSRNSQGDLALSKALDGIQAAATRLETERTKLVIQSQELQIWDMAREEELVLLRAENEQLEQRLATFSEKVSKGLGRDGVLDSLHFALRKARSERDAEVHEADGLFNQLQEAKAAAEELRELRAAFVAALSSLDDEWSAIPLLSEEARQLRSSADAAVKDPTNLGQAEIVTLLRGLLTLASRGSELQQDVQTLRGEKAALQLALDAAQQQLAEQAEQLEKLRLVAAADQQPAALPADVGRSKAGGVAALDSNGDKVARSAQDLQQEQGQDEAVAAALKARVVELEGKLAEYRSWLEENHEQIEALQMEVKTLKNLNATLSSNTQRQHAAQAVDAAAATHHVPHVSQHGAKPSSRRSSLAGVRPLPGTTASCSAGAATSSADASCRRQLELQEQQPKHYSMAQQQGLQQVAGTPTRHVPSTSSPISTVNYGTSPAAAGSLSARGSPTHHSQSVADIAHKVAELQELALRAQQQAAEREVDTLREHEQQLEALRQELAQEKAEELAALTAQLTEQHAQVQAQAREQLAKALADVQARETEVVQQLAQIQHAVEQAQAREAELLREHEHALAELESERDRLTEQHTKALSELRTQLADLSAHHARELEEHGYQAEQRFKQREAELQQLQTEAVEQQTAQAEAALVQALAEQASRLAADYAEDLKQLTARLAQQHAQREKELEEGWQQRFAQQGREVEERLVQQHERRERDLREQLEQQRAEQQARRDSEMRVKHAERIAQQAAQLAALHAEQAAALAAQHAEQLAEREAQLLQEYERRLAEHEDELAVEHADQMRALEARSTAQAAEAAAGQEARLRHLHAQQIVEALQTQHAALAAEAEARMQQVRLSHEDEVARLVQAHAEDVRRREDEFVRQLEEVRLRVQDLECQLAEAQGAAAAEVAAAAAEAAEAAQALRRELAERDGQLEEQAQQLAELMRCYAEAQAAMETARQQQEEAVTAMERQCVEVVARLGREHEQATADARTAHELRENNLRQALERQAQAAQQAQHRHGERLKEMQDHVAELQELLAREREHHVAHSDALKARLDQLAYELETARGEALQLQHREAALRHEDRRDRPPVPRGRQLLVSDRECTSPGLSDRGHHSPTASPGGECAQQQLPALQLSESPERSTGIKSPVSASAANAVGGSGVSKRVRGSAAQSRPDLGADAWQDGQALLWPEGAQAPSDTMDDSVTSASPPADTTDTALALTALTHGANGAGPELVRRSEQDLAANLLRALRVLETDVNGPGGRSGKVTAIARLWNASLELNDRRAPKRGLLQQSIQSTDAESSLSPAKMVVAGAEQEEDMGAVLLLLQAAAAQASEERSEAIAQAVGQSGSGVVTAGTGRDSAAACRRVCVSSASGPSLEDYAEDDGGGVGYSQYERGEDKCSGGSTGDEKEEEEADEWGELVAAPPPLPADDPQPAQPDGSPAGTGPDPVPDLGPGPIVPSGAASSVSTTSSYNSSTEFYVDDEDDEEQRGRALAAALAQSPRSSLTTALPPLLLEIQERRRSSQSLGTSSPSGTSPLESPTRPDSGCDKAIVAVAASPEDARPPPLSFGGDVSSSAADGVVEDIEQQSQQQQERSSPGPLAATTLRPSPPMVEVSQQPAERRRRVDLVTCARPAAHGARLLGGFPVPLLPRPPAMDAPAVLPQAPEDAATTTMTTSQPAAAASTPSLRRSGSFTFSGHSPESSRRQDELTPDGATSSGCSGTCAEAAAGGSCNGAPSDGPVGTTRQVQAADLTASFDFSPKGRLWSTEPATEVAPAPEPAVWGEDRPWSSTRHSGDGADGCRRRRRLSSLHCEKRSEEAGDGAEGDGGGSISFDSSSSSSLPSPSTDSLSPRLEPLQQWGSGAEAGPASTVVVWSPDADRTPLHGGIHNAACWSTDDSGCYSQQSGEGAASTSGSTAGDISRTLPAGVRPLMATNPLYSNGEPSPPWSTADWGTPRESASAPSDDNPSIPSTPGSEASASGSREGEGSRSSDSQTWDRNLSFAIPHSGPEATVDRMSTLTAPAAVSTTAPDGNSNRCGSLSTSPRAQQLHQQATPTPIGLKRVAGLARWHDLGNEGCHTGEGAAAGAGPSDSASVIDRECGPAQDDMESRRVMASCGSSQGGGSAIGGRALCNNAARRRYEDARASGGHDPKAAGVSPRQEEAQNASGSAAVQVKEAGEEEEEQEDARSLLAAGATLGSSERRRRQRRRMGDAPEPLRHPVDLLRQSWEFVRGVATPLSPRSAANDRVQGYTVGDMSLRAAAVVAAAAGMGPSQRDVREAETQCAEQQGLTQPQQDPSLLPLRTLAQVIESLGGISPRSARSPRVRTSPGPSLPTTLPTPSTGSTERSAAAGASPRTPTSPPAHLPSSPIADGAAGASYTGIRPASASAGQGETGRLALALSPRTTASTPASLPVSAMEARQRSRTVLERAMSRVAELEGQCRALAAALPATPAADDAATDSARLRRGGSPVWQPVWQPAPQAVVDGSWLAVSPAQQVAALLGGSMPGASPTTSWMVQHGRGELALVAPGGEAPSPLSSPAVAAEVIGALEDLRVDLYELEQLHHFTKQSGSALLPGPEFVEDGSIPGLGLSVELHPQKQLASASALLLPPPANMSARVEEGDGSGTVRSWHGLPGGPQQGGDGGEVCLGGGADAPGATSGTWQTSQLPAGFAGVGPQPAIAPAFEARLEAVARPGDAAGVSSAVQHVAPFTATYSSPCRTPCLHLQAQHQQDERRLPVMPQPQLHPSSASPSNLPATSQGLSPGGATPSPLQQQHHQQPALLSPPLAAAGAAASPMALDPALVSLLRQSIQEQLQGQLGQLQAEIAELKRRNEELLLGSTAAATPATPLPLADYTTRGSAAATGVCWTPLSMAPLLDSQVQATGAGRADVAVGSRAAANRPLQLGGGAGVCDSASGSGQQWAGTGEALVRSAGPGGGSVMVSGTPQLPVTVCGGEVGTGGAGGHTSMTVYPSTSPAAVRVVSPGQAVSCPVSEDVHAGPYSPEELSQLPPTVQLYAPPQLRAAAWAAAREHLNRRTT